MNTQNRWGFDWFEFIFGILLLVAAVLLMFHPAISVAGLAIMGAILLLVAGITSIWSFKKLMDYVGIRSYAMLIAGILELVLAVVFLFEMHAAVAVIGILFALFVIIDSIAELIVASHLRKFNGGIYWGSIILDIVVLVLGFLLLFHPTITAMALSFLIALLLVIIAINMILMAFGHRL